MARNLFQELGIKDPQSLLAQYEKRQKVNVDPSTQKAPELQRAGSLAEAFGGGVRSTARSLGATVDVLQGDEAEILEASKRPSTQTLDQRRFRDALEARKADDPEDAGIWEAIKNVGGAIGEAPTGALHETAAQVPNSMAVLGSAGAGALAGSALGGPVGAIIGGIAGMYLGNAGVETGGIALGQAGEEGKVDTDLALRQGATKAGVITGIDTATLGVNRLLLGAPGKAASKAVTNLLASRGIDPADAAKVTRALKKDPNLARSVREAGLSAFDAAMPKGANKAARIAAAMALETGAEGTGEYLGSKAAGLEADMTEAVLESMLSVPQSVAETGIAAALGRKDRDRKSFEKTLPADPGPRTKLKDLGAKFADKNLDRMADDVARMREEEEAGVAAPTGGIEVEEFRDAGSLEQLEAERRRLLGERAKAPDRQAQAEIDARIFALDDEIELARRETPLPEATRGGIAFSADSLDYEVEEIAAEEINLDDATGFGAAADRIKTLRNIVEEAKAKGDFATMRKADAIATRLTDRLREQDPAAAEAIVPSMTPLQALAGRLREKTDRMRREAGHRAAERDAAAQKGAQMDQMDRQARTEAQLTPLQALGERLRKKTEKIQADIAAKAGVEPPATSGITVEETDEQGDPIEIRPTSGKPYKDEKSARNAAKIRKLDQYEPVQADDGWVLRKRSVPEALPTDGIEVEEIGGEAPANPAMAEAFARAGVTTGKPPEGGGPKGGTGGGKPAGKPRMPATTGERKQALKEAGFRTTGSAQEIEDRFNTLVEAYDTFKKYKTQDEIEADLKSGALDRKKVARMADAARDRAFKNSGTSDGLLGMLGWEANLARLINKLRRSGLDIKPREIFPGLQGDEANRSYELSRKGQPLMKDGVPVEDRRTPEEEIEHSGLRAKDAALRAGKDMEEAEEAAEAARQEAKKKAPLNVSDKGGEKRGRVRVRQDGASLTLTAVEGDLASNGDYAVERVAADTQGVEITLRNNDGDRATLEIDNNGNLSLNKLTEGGARPPAKRLTLDRLRDYLPPKIAAGLADLIENRGDSVYLVGTEHESLISIFSPAEQGKPSGAQGVKGALGKAERRKDLARRQRVDQMSFEEMRRELLIDALTGLGNRRAYDETVTPESVHAYIDVDALKWVNDNMGHQSGDELLKAMGDALREAISLQESVDGPDATGYHLSGDEFVILGSSPEQVEKIAIRAQAIGERAVLEYTAPDGSVITKQGVQFSYGIGKSLEEADEGLKRHKDEREKSGLRAARGETPSGVATRPAEGGQTEVQGELVDEEVDDIGWEYWRGKNANGETLYADPDGVRYVIENGNKIRQKVRTVKVKGGTKVEPIPDDRFVNVDATFDNWDYEVASFPEPEKTARGSSLPGADLETEISQDEADAIVESWRERAKEIGRTEDNSDKVIVSLFDATGIASQPWRDAGYTVLQYDIKLDDDLMEYYPAADLDEVKAEGKRIVGIIAQPPCTCFSASGARWWNDRHDKADVDMVDKMFGVRASRYFSRPKDYTKALVALVDLMIGEEKPDFFFLENPVGRIATEMGLPKPTLRFHPHNYGDPYTKSTQLWGRFNTGLPTANVNPTKGSMIAKLPSSAKAAREATPKGFAYAFFMANHPSAMGDGVPNVVIPFPYASGMTRPADFAAAMKSDAGIGVDASEISGPMVDQIAEAANNGKQVFIDSGAFRAFKRMMKSGVESFVDFDKVFDLYFRISDRLEKGAHHNVMLVMPDVVGDQEETFQLIRQYHEKIAELDARGHEIIIPLQGGEKSLLEFYDDMVTELGHAGFVAGIPSNAKAVDQAQLEELLRERKPNRIHILGAVQSKALADRVSLIKKHIEDVGVTADANLLRSKINGMIGLPRAARDSRIANILNKATPAAWRVGSVDEAANEAATSPENGTPEPTDRQKEAGNYKKGHLRLHGLDISIENPKGSTRSGVSPTGKAWRTKLKDHYGYIKGTVGRDKDHIDVFLGPNAEDPNLRVYVIDQRDPGTNTFDEHKVMIGYRTGAEARVAYQRNYQKGWSGAAAITPMTLEDFKVWVFDKEKTSKPADASLRDSPSFARSLKRKDTSIGRNANGDEIFQDSRGVRYIRSGGVRIEQKVEIRPTRSGMAVTPVDDGDPRFEPVEQKAKGRPANIGEIPGTIVAVDDSLTPPSTVNEGLRKAGWIFHDARDSDRAYRDSSGSRFPTFEKNGTRIALRAGRSLAANRGTVEVYDDEPKSVIVEWIMVEADRRRQGRADAALTELARLADETNSTLYIEPVPLEKVGAAPKSALISLYAKHGFDSTTEQNLVMVRRPKKPKGKQAQESSNPYSVPDGFKITAIGKVKPGTVDDPTGTRGGQITAVVSREAPFKSVRGYGKDEAEAVADAMRQFEDAPKAQDEYRRTPKGQPTVPDLVGEGDIVTIHGEDPRWRHRVVSVERVAPHGEYPESFDIEVASVHDSDDRLVITEVVADDGVLRALFVDDEDVKMRLVERKGQVVVPTDPMELAETIQDRKALIDEVREQIVETEKSKASPQIKQRQINKFKRIIDDLTREIGVLDGVKSGRPANIGEIPGTTFDPGDVEANVSSEAVEARLVESRLDEGFELIPPGGYPKSLPKHLRGKASDDWTIDAPGGFTVGSGKTPGEAYEQYLAWKETPDTDTAGGARTGKPGGAGSFGKSNKIFTEDAAKKAAELLRKKLGQLNAGIDPEMLQAGLTLAGYYIEGGIRKFADFAKVMIAGDGNMPPLGDAAKPYLRSWYESVRHYPGVDNEGMTQPEHIEREMAAMEEGERLERNVVSRVDIGNGTEIHVVTHGNGDHAVLLFDTDAGQYLDSVKVFHGENSLMEALAYADSVERKGSDRPASYLETLANDLYEGRRFASIVDARKRVAELTGGAVAKAGTVEAKRADEIIEQAGVLAARKIVEDQQGELETFDRLQDLADRMPNLNVRTSTSIAQQAYSTPFPLAYLASRLAGIDRTMSVVEPTAGNGALLMEASPAYTMANELNADRRAFLKAQGFEPYGENAVTFDFGAPVTDVVIANPPFGIVKDDAGNTIKYPITPEYNTSEIDHAIALNALKSLKDDGKAVLIIGGPSKTLSDEARSDSYNGKAKRTFFYTLYNQYRVVDHFTVSGDLYAKQGAAWPVDVLVIEGRGKSSRKLPAADLPRKVDTIEELRNELENRGDRTEAVGTLGGRSGPAIDDGTAVGSTGGSRNSVQSEDGESVDVLDGLDGQPQFAGGASGAPVGQPDRSGDSRGPDPQSDSVKNEYQAPYTPASASPAVGTLLPVNLREPVTRALEAISDRHGSVDKFVAKELGYALEEIPGYFSAEQVDALALALDQIKRGKGFIIGDQTGVGKGRVVAGMIRWAMREGKMPVFVTEKPNLYGDMMRDLADIGMPDAKPFMTNTSLSIPLDGDALAWFEEAELAKANGNRPPKKRGKFLSSPGASVQSNEMTEMLNGSRPAPEMIFTTYSQMQTVKGVRTQRMDFIEQFARGGMVILDESHNAGGTTETGPMSKKDADEFGKTGRAAFVRQIVGVAGGVFYSSATYAKRPDVMDLYFKTDMGEVMSGSELAAAIKAGGVPLQQVVATMLADAGQYIRREKSFDGIRYETTPTETNKQFAENAATIMRGIMQFDRMKIAALDALDKELKAGARQISGDKSTGGAGAMSTNFTSVMHNLLGQMLLTLTVDAAADRAIAALKAGEKPVIAVSNTMGSAIDEYAKLVDLKPGDPINLSFADLMKRYLEKSRRVIEGDPFGKKTSRFLTDEELGPAASFYYKLMKKIDDMGFDRVPVSPIDAIHQRLRDAGYKTGEITGRNDIIDYSSGTPIYRRRPSKEKSTAGKTKTIADFNSGKMDAIILNQSGATGLSLHASERFSDQSPRVMILAQAELNIDTHMQMLGRVNRTGQVTLPRYEQLVPDIPASKRPASILARKMASLNANTTGARDSALKAKDSPDFMNEYGDMVAAQVMMDNPEWHTAMGSPLKAAQRGDGLEPKEAMRKVSGRIPVLSLANQQIVYDTIEEAYLDLLDTMRRSGQNALEAETMELDAVVESTQEIRAPSGSSGSPFAAPVNAEIMDVKKIGNPYKLEQIADLLDKEAPGSGDLKSRVDRWKSETTSKMETDVDEYYAKLTDDFTDEQTKQRDAAIARVKNNARKVSGLIYNFGLNAPVMLTTSNGMSYYGIIGKIEHKGASPNPVAPGTWHVTIYVADAARSFKIPLSRLGGSMLYDSETEGKSILQSADRDSVEAAFVDVHSSTREKRTIMTGNLLAAFGAFNTGQIINFRMKDGHLRQGILMPQKFNLKEAEKQLPVNLTMAQAHAFLTELSGIRFLHNPDKSLRIGNHEESFILRVPAAKSAGGKFYLNESLLRAVGGDFVKSGSDMRVTFPPSRLEKVLGALDGIGVKLQATTRKEEAATYAGGPGRFSVGRGRPATVGQVRDEIASLLTRKSDLLTSGKIQIVQTEAELPDHLRRPGTRGVVDPKTGTIYLVADNIGGEVKGVFLHELGVHHGLRQILGSKFADVLKQMRGLRAIKNADALAAYARVPADTPAGLVDEEALGYLIEVAAGKPMGILRKVIAAVRAFLFRKGIIVKNLTVDDMLALAGAAARRADIAPLVGASAAHSRGTASLTGTPEFRAWFGGSKVVGENGAPLVVYHGRYDVRADTDPDPMPDGIARFQPGRGERGIGAAEQRDGKRNVHTDGIWFGGLGSAEQYAGVWESDPEFLANASIYPVYLKIENPAKRSLAELRKIKVGDLQAEGYDGVYVVDTGDWVAFDPAQIKSAIGNTGAFDSANPDIRYSRLSEAIERFRNPPEPTPERAANDALRERDRPLWDRLTKELRRQLAPGGLLPSAVFKLKIQRDSKFEVTEIDAKNLLAGLEGAVKAAWGHSMRETTDDQRRLMGDILAGREAEVPDGIRDELVKMRIHVDRLSAEYTTVLAGEINDLIENNRSEEAKARASLLQTIVDNIGEYVHRSYRAFDDPKWANNVPDEVLNNARRYLREQYQAKAAKYDEWAAKAMDRGDVEIANKHIERAQRLRSPQLVENRIEAILKEGKAFDSMESFIRETKLGAMDLSVLKRRKQIAPEIRALLGEYVDPRVNYAKSVTKMSRLIWNARFLDRVKEIGLGDFLWREGDPARPTGAWKKIASKTPQYNPIGGLYTYPEIEEAFREILDQEQMADWYRFIVQVNGMVKYGKTVLSPTTAARNWMSALFFTVANGHFNLAHGATSVRAFREYMHSRDRGRLHQYLRHLKELGVVYDTPYAGEMMRLLEDSRLEDIMAGEKRATVKEWLDLATRFYQFGDDFWKIIGFENEKAILMKHKRLSESEAEAAAAERIRNTYPTYSMVGKFIKALRRFPLAGTFVSFPAEIIRTTYHILRYLKQDMQDPDMRPVAVRRIVGLSAASGLVYAAQAIAMSLLGVSDDEEEAFRDLAAPWQRNSNILPVTRDEKGNLRFIDMSFLDPYNYWKRPINAILRDQPYEDMAVEIARETLTPFFGTDILAGAIMEWLLNKKESGGRVYNPSADPVSQTMDVVNHIRKAVQPGIASNVERTYLALQGQVSPSGRTYNLMDEGAAFIGWRVSTFDAKAAMYFKAFEFQDRKRDATSILTTAARNPNEVSDEELRYAYERAMVVRDQAYTEMLRLIDAARNSGLSDVQVARSLRDSGVSSKDVGSLMRGVIPKWVPAKGGMRQAIRKAHLLFGPDVERELERRRREIIGFTQP